MGFRKVILRRLADTAAIMVLVFIVNFFLLYMRMPRANIELPIWENFVEYLQFVFIEGLGRSARGGQPTLEKIGGYIPYTVLLVGTSTLYAIALGAVIGVIAAWRRNEKIDYALRFGLVVPFAMPIFYWAMILMVTFCVQIKLFPLRGAFTIPPPLDPLVRVLDVVHHMTLPTLVLTVAVVYVFFMTTRGSMLDELKQRYVLTAQAKGLKESSIIFRHVLRNALLPLTALSGLAFVILITAESMVEYLFSWHGLGLLLYESIILRLDLPVLQGIFLFYSAIVLIGSFLSDLLHCLLDPRLRKALGESEKTATPKPTKDSLAGQTGHIKLQVFRGKMDSMKRLRTKLRNGVPFALVVVGLIFILIVPILSPGLGVNSASLSQDSQSSSEDIVFSFKWGGRYVGPDSLLTPTGLAIDSGLIYIADTANDIVHIYRLNGTIVTAWNGDDDEIEHLRYPIDVAISPLGYVYVSTAEGRVLQFDKNGTEIHSWLLAVSGGGIISPSGVCVDSTGDVFVVCSEGHEVQKYSSSGDFIDSWGSHGYGPGRFEYPQGICVDDNDFLYVADTGNYRIQKFTNNGGFVLEWGHRGWDNSEFRSPDALDVDSEGNIYITDPDTTQIKKFMNNGTFITSWNMENLDWFHTPVPAGITLDQQDNFYISDPANLLTLKFDNEGQLTSTFGYSNPPTGHFTFPHGIEIDDAGYIYVADTYNGRVQKFTRDGDFILAVGTRGIKSEQMLFPMDVAVDSEGYMYVTDYDRGLIQKYSSNGTFVQSWGGVVAPYGIDIDEEGYVYVVDRARHQVKKFTNNGTVVAVWGEQGVEAGRYWYPYFVEVDSDGNNYVGDRYSRITKYTNEGDFLRAWYFVGAEPYLYGGLIVGGFAIDNGLVYAVIPSLGQVQIYTVDGDYVEFFSTSGSGSGDLGLPFDIAADSEGNVYVVDFWGCTLAKYGAPPPTPIQMAWMMFLGFVHLFLQNIIPIIIITSVGLFTVNLWRVGLKPSLRYILRLMKQGVRLTIRTWRSPSGKVGIVIAGVLGLLGLVGPMFFDDPYSTYYPYSPTPPSPEHLLGLDEWGRDVFTRLIWGAQASVSESIISVSMAVVFGALIGCIAGFYSDRWIGYFLDRFIDLFLTVPLIMLIIFNPMGGAASIFRSGFITGMGSWGITAKLVRARVLPVPQRPYYEAARAAGAGSGHLLVRYVVPETLPGLFSGLTYTTVIAVTLQATLDFFGFERAVGSINEVMISPVLSWGSMISYSRSYATLGLSRWWTVLPAAICLTLLVLSFIMIGSGLAEAYEAPIPAVLKTYRRKLKKS